jgi:serine phosphatase RsbU (regulator of sigma subunit)
VLFTDGITDAREADAIDQPDVYDDFGEERLVGVARENRGRGAAALQQCLSDAVSSFAGGAFQDDATLIVVAMC